MVIRKSSLLVALLIAPWFTFALGLKWPLLGVLINICRVMGIGFALLHLLRSERIRRNFFSNSYLIPMGILYGMLFISTIINGKNISDAIQLAMYGFWPFVVLSLLNTKKEVGNVFLEGIVISFSALIIINLILMLAYSDGIYTTYTSATVTKYYLFGAKNQAVAPLMTALIFFVEYSLGMYNRVTCPIFLLCTLCIIEIIMAGSGTGILMVALFIILCFYQIWKARNISSTVTIFVVLGLTVGLVILRIQNWFDFIIVSILHKSLTLSDRIYIWDAALETIRAYPWIGTGVSESLAGDVLLNLSYLSKNTFAHNMVLDFLVMGGWSTLVSFLAILYVTKRYYDNSIAVLKDGKSCIWIGVILYLIASIVEIYTGNYCLFLMMAYIVSLPKVECDNIK